MADSSSEPVVVIGLGRFGSSLALELTSRGTEVLAIDSRSKVVQSLAGQLTHTVTADCTDIEALRQLGVPDFSRAVVAIGSDIESSILVTSLLTELEIEHIWAKAISIQHGRILDRIGAHHVVFPEHDMGERVAHLVSGRMLDYIELDPAHALVKVSPPGELVGVPLREARVRSRYDVTVVAVRPSDGEFTYTTPDTVLAYGDVILILGRIDKVERFADLP
ncbi:TrkA family potassium uptake protein [Streptomyces albus]|uniref:potassium channel family protein n=1 Tax=Streptomyces albus TaxID=1888 RepID=UPI0004C8A447|nr:TrkA family potassium uptake protein [Streptomyces albus]